MNIDARVVVLFHSGHGHTAKLAMAVAGGAASVAGVTVAMIAIEDGGDPPWAELEQADAIIFGTPTYMGGPSAGFKAFQESTSGRIFASGLKWRDKLAAGFTVSASRSGDKLGTLIQLALFAAQHGMHWVNLALLPGNHSSAGSEADLNRLGFFLGAGAQANADEPADTAPPASDLMTGRHLGARVAGLAVLLNAGYRALGKDLMPCEINAH